MTSLRRALERAQALRKRAWQIDARGLGRWPRRALMFYRILATVIRDTQSDRITERAKALTYTTLLSLVPALALFFSIVQGFGGAVSHLVETYVQPFILKNLAVGAQEQVQGVILQFVDRAHAGALGGLGFIGLLYTTASLLLSIEGAFDDLWGVHRKRSVGQRVVLYWTLITVGPVLLGASLAATAAFQSSHVVQWASSSIPAALTPLHLAPYAFTLIAFTLIYFIVPNAKVSFRASATGGVLAGAAWEIAKLVYTYYTRRFVGYSAIYGAFGAIPLFMLWIYATWLIVLAGAEVAFAYEAVDTVADERRLGGEPSIRLRELVTLRLMAEICDRFQRGAAHADRGMLARHVGVPLRLVNEAVDVLVAAGFVVESGEAAEHKAQAKTSQAAPGGALVPTREPARITVAAVLAALRDTGAAGEHVEPRADALTEVVRALVVEQHHAEGQCTEAVDFAALSARAVAGEVAT